MVVIFQSFKKWNKLSNNELNWTTQEASLVDAHMEASMETSLVGAQVKTSTNASLN